MVRSSVICEKLTTTPQIMSHAPHFSREPPVPSQGMPARRALPCLYMFRWSDRWTEAVPLQPPQSPPRGVPRRSGRPCHLRIWHSRIIRLDRACGRHDGNESVPFDRSLPVHRRRRESCYDVRPKFVHVPLYLFDYCTVYLCFLHCQSRRLWFVPQRRTQLVEPKNNMFTVLWVHRYREHVQLGDRCISHYTKHWFLATSNRIASSSLTVTFCKRRQRPWYYQWSILQDLHRLRTTVCHCMLFGTSGVPTLGELVRSHKHNCTKILIRVAILVHLSACYYSCSTLMVSREDLVQM